MILIAQIPSEGGSMALTAIQVKSAKATDKPKKLSDGGGLYLLVQPTGARYWRLDYRFAAKRKTLAIGVYPDVSLSVARERREDARKMLATIPSRRVALDDSGMIEYEYTLQCKQSPEWLDSWLSDGYQQGRIVLVDAKPQAIKAKKVEAFGFPKGNKDLWYIKTALAIQQVHPLPTVTHLITEDIDLYDPKKKKSCKDKAKFFKAGKGPVANHLKSLAVIVCCISTFNMKYP